MVQHVSRAEEFERSNSSVFAERQEELDAMATKMPKRITGQFPYLMEIRTGVIHPFTESLAERSDLVVGCYNLDGSMDPNDADPYYDPQALAMQGERLRRVNTVGPRTVAEQKAAQAEAISAARREERAKAEAEFEERLARELAKRGATAAEEAKPAAPQKPKSQSKKAKSQVADAPKAEAAPKAEVAPAPADTQGDAGGTVDSSVTDLNQAFQEAMK